MLALAGAELLRRGTTGHCMLYSAIGYNGANDDGRPAATLRGDRDRSGHRRELRGAAATVNARRSIKIERSITVGRSRLALYEFWRDFQNLPRVLDHLESVELLDAGRSHWVARGPGNARLEWDAEIVNDIPGQLIAWKTIGNPDVPHAGSVHFADAPGGRGTEVRLVIDYEPTGGRIAAVAAKFAGESPDQKIRDDLERLKLALETGETVTIAGQPSAR
jgi:uncharacterized membrane protein